MSSRCLSYERGQCLVEVTEERRSVQPRFVARIFFVDAGDQGPIVRPMVDLDGHGVKVADVSERQAVRRAARYLERQFGRLKTAAKHCGLAAASIGRPVVVADLAPDLG